MTSPAAADSAWNLPMVLAAAEPLAKAWQCDVRGHICNGKIVNGKRQLAVHLEFRRDRELMTALWIDVDGPDGLDRIDSADGVRAEVERSVAFVLTLCVQGSSA